MCDARNDGAGGHKKFTMGIGLGLPIPAPGIVTGAFWGVAFAAFVTV